MVVKRELRAGQSGSTLGAKSPNAQRIYHMTTTAVRTGESIAWKGIASFLLMTFVITYGVSLP
jgi:hypothetical protein